MIINKTFNKSCEISKDSDQHVHAVWHVHPASMARVLVYPSLASPDAAECTCESEDPDQTARMRMLV